MSLQYQIKQCASPLAARLFRRVLAESCQMPCFSDLPVEKLKLDLLYLPFLHLEGTKVGGL